MRRRDLLKTGALLTAATSFMRPRLWADVPDHLWEGYPFGSPQVSNRLNQGPFGIEQDQGWFTIFATQPSRDHIRNFGGGLVGYTWEENGPALGVQCGSDDRDAGPSLRVAHHLGQPLLRNRAPHAGFRYPTPRPRPGSRHVPWF